MSILRRLELYFSNSSYVKDIFLRTKCEKGNGIRIETILTFQKLKKHNATEEDIRGAFKEQESYN